MDGQSFLSLGSPSFPKSAGEDLVYVLLGIVIWLPLSFDAEGAFEHSLIMRQLAHI